MNLFLRLVSEQAGTSSWEAVKEPGAGKTDAEGWTGTPASVSLGVLVTVMWPTCTWELVKRNPKRYDSGLEKEEGDHICTRGRLDVCLLPGFQG